MQQRTSPEQRAKLAATGFVRVDGLRMFREGFPEEGVKIELSLRHLGHWEHNNGMTVIVSEAGEVWLAVGSATQERSKKMEQLVGELCPNGRGAFVPCSNGEELRPSDILERMADPDWQPRY